ncbi:hypothetical protein [Clostridium sp.]|uniref:hypothetical protein n=1 Tax=Clostridium sp. TaxID=1506 RepID=UPI003F3A05A6
MKKLMTMFVLSLCLVFSFTTVASAGQGTTTAKELHGHLKELGVPSAYIGNIVEYLQKVKVSKKEADAVLAKADEALAIIGDTTNLSLLSKADKEKLQTIATDAGKILGLNVSFGRDAKGVTTVLVTDKHGNIIIEANTHLVIKIVNNFKASKLIEVVKAAIDFSNNPKKHKFDPITGDLNNTGTNTMATMLFGAGIMSLGGASLFALRKIV